MTTNVAIVKAPPSTGSISNNTPIPPSNSAINTFSTLSKTEKAKLEQMDPPLENLTPILDIATGVAAGKVVYSAGKKVVEKVGGSEAALLALDILVSTAGQIPHDINPDKSTPPAARMADNNKKSERNVQATKDAKALGNTFKSSGRR